MATKQKTTKTKASTPKKSQSFRMSPLLFLAVFALVFGTIGVAYLLKGKASTSSIVLASSEAESLSIPASAKIVSDDAAVGAKAVQLIDGNAVTGSVSFSSPVNQISVRAKAGPCRGSSSLVVMVDNQQVLATSVGSTSWAIYSAGTTLSAGTHNVSMKFTNPSSKRNCTRSLILDNVSFLGDNPASTTPPPASDTTSPAVSLTSPINGTTASGTISITASASDNTGVKSLEFYIDNSKVSTVTAPPYTYAWNTTTANNVSHTLGVKAYDAAGNVGTAANITVTVNNQSSTAATSPSGAAMPVGDVVSNGHTWKQILTEDFTKDAPLGSWASDCDAGKILYTGATGTSWRAYPKCYLDTYQKRPYRSDQVLSVHNGSLDFWLHAVDGKPAGANPSPLMPNGTQYQTYGRYEARFRVTTNTLSDYYTAWLLWPQDESKWQCAESDFPESQLSSGTTSAYAHYGCSGSQDAYSKTLDKTQWHTYTQEWQPGKRTYYLDGVKIGESTNQVYAGAQRWQLQTETQSNCESTSSCTQDGHLLVDWAVVYAY